MKTIFEENVSRLQDFRRRAEFKRRAQKDFFSAYKKDDSSVSHVITWLLSEVYNSYMMSEYGLSGEEEERILEDRIHSLPRRFIFLINYTHFISKLKRL